MSNFKPVIGLEIHVELKTESGMFCRCKVGQFKAEANSHVCPVCLGLPGALPVPNNKAIEWTVLIGKALNCTINKHSKFDRKHYSYPDLPKGYQISQYDEPIAVNGKFRIQNSEFRITRVHLEEDTGKLMHSGSETLIDFNRSGTPLVEIVTEPDFDNVEDVVRFLQELQVIVRYLGVSDADMEKGTMRLEPNISVREIRNSKFEIPNKSKIIISKDKNELPKYKVEVKNINSFRFVRQAIEYELKRQQDLLEKGETPKQETRGFDEKKQITYSQRSKEEAHDYRYFPEPDIPPLEFSDEYLEGIFKQLPELPAQKAERYVKNFGLKREDAFRITRSKNISDFYEKVISKIKIQNSKIHLKNQKLEQVILNFILNKKISSDLTIEQFCNEAVKLLAPKVIDEARLESLISQLIKSNPKAVADYKGGKQNALMFLVGQVMREMKGKADAKEVIKKIKERLR